MPLSEVELRSILARHIQDAEDYRDSEILAPAEDAERLYLGGPLGTEVDGRSKVVSKDLQDAVEWAMPSLMRMFHGTDQPVSFEPAGPEDEGVAEQATDYVSYVYNKDNPGFLITETLLKSGLLYRFAAVKRWWETKERRTRERLQGLTEDELTLVLQEDGVTLAEADEPKMVTVEGPDGQPVEVQTYDVAIERVTVEGRERIEAVPPQEFLIDRRAKSVDDAAFVAHRRTLTRSDLLELGYPRDKVELVPYDDDDDSDDQRFASAGRDIDSDRDDASGDESRRLVTLYECYVLIDEDGDGEAELRRIVVGGKQAAVILEDDLACDRPFHGFTAVLLPHRLAGQSFADLLKDIQTIKTTLWRQMLDGLYLSTSPVTDVTTTAIDPTVGLSDVLVRVPGGIRRWKDINGVRESAPEWPGAQAFPMVQYLDATAEGRSGAGRSMQGLNPDLLNPSVTATAATHAMTQAQSRLELIARRFAELVMKPLFRGMLRDLVQYQDKPRMVRMRGQWVPIDPRPWNVDMDVTVSVGLGTGSREQRAMALQMVLGLQEKIAMAGPAGRGMVTPQQIYNAAKDFCRALELPSPDPYFLPPQPPDPNEQPPPDPEMLKLQAQTQAKIAEAQAKAELDRQKAAADIQLAREKAVAEMQAMRERNAAEIALMREKAQWDHDLRMRELEAEIELKRLAVQTPAVNNTNVARPQ